MRMTDWQACILLEMILKTTPPKRSSRTRVADADPYKPARRPAREKTFERAPRPARDADASARYGARRFGTNDEVRRTPSPRASSRPRGGEDGFTVTLDPDVARVFRGDASVNKALRLVLQLMQVVQGPPARAGAARPSGPRTGGYRGSVEARGFERKPRFDDDDE